MNNRYSLYISTIQHNSNNFVLALCSKQLVSQQGVHRANAFAHRKSMKFIRNVQFQQRINDVVARAVAKEMKIFCWILTSSNNHESRAIHVKATWAHRCDKFVFISTENNSTLPAITLKNVEQGDNYLWGQTKAAFKYSWQQFGREYDWFLKADDDTYVVIENLRYMLIGHRPSTPIYFGCRLKHNAIKQGYMSGNAGYVLSREALRKFIEEALPYPQKCRPENTGAEDVEMGICLQNVGVRAGDSRDHEKKHRFMPFIPEHHVVPGQKDPNFWFWKNIYYPMEPGMNCCSDHSITFHYVTPGQMYVLEYLIYHLRAYGINYFFPTTVPQYFASDQMIVSGGNVDLKRLLAAIRSDAMRDRGPDDAALYVARLSKQTSSNNLNTTQ